MAESGLVPDCSIVRNAELSIGDTLYFGDGRKQLSDLWLSGKTLIRTLESSSWSIGMVIGYVHIQITHPAEQNWATCLHVLRRARRSPTSASFADERVSLHGNLGVIRTDEHGRIRPTWSFGSESHITKRFGMIAEMYGDTFRRDIVSCWFAVLASAGLPSMRHNDCCTGRPEPSEPMGISWSTLADARVHSVNSPPKCEI